MKQCHCNIRLCLSALACAGSLFLGGGAQAQLSLTQAGIDAGFSLTTFADNFPSTSTVGPLGIGFTSTGGVIVGDYPGNVRVFPTDTDGQHANSVAVAQNYGIGNAVGIAQAAGAFYMTRQTIGDLVQIDANGTFNQVIVGGMPTATGIIGNPNNGHIFVSTVTNNVIWDIDPIAKTKTVFKNVNADGLSTDGVTLYATVSGHIIGFNLLNQAQTFDSGFIPNGPDGAAIGQGALAGNIFVNTNNGTLYGVNLTSLAQTLIASGGSRGDFVAADPNGSLLVTQTDRVQRLTAPTGGGFAQTPEPGSLALLVGVGITGSVFLKRRRKKAVTASSIS